MPSCLSKNKSPRAHFHCESLEYHYPHSICYGTQSPIPQWHSYLLMPTLHGNTKKFQHSIIDHDTQTLPIPTLHWDTSGLTMLTFHCPSLKPPLSSLQCANTPLWLQLPSLLRHNAWTPIGHTLLWHSEPLLPTINYHILGLPLPTHHCDTVGLPRLTSHCEYAGIPIATFHYETPAVTLHKQFFDTFSTSRTHIPVLQPRPSTANSPPWQCQDSL